MTKEKTVSMNKRLQHSFTLIELLVVVAIIGILASLLLPVLAKVRRKGKVVICTNQLKQVAVTWISYAGDFEETYPDYTPEDEHLTVTNEFSRARRTIWQLGRRGHGDLRPILFDYMGNLDDLFVCPLQVPWWQAGNKGSAMLKLEHRDSNGNYINTNVYGNEGGPYSSYNIYPTSNPNPVGFKTRQRMRKVGDRFETKVNGPGSGKTYGIIANDLMYKINQYLDRMTVDGMKSGHQPPGGGAEPGGSYSNLCTFGWDLPKFVSTDFNFALDDGSVTTYRGVNYYSYLNESFYRSEDGDQRTLMFPADLAE